MSLASSVFTYAVVVMLFVVTFHFTSAAVTAFPVYNKYIMERVSTGFPQTHQLDAVNVDKGLYKNVVTRPGFNQLFYYYYKNNTTSILVSKDLKTSKLDCHVDTKTPNVFLELLNPLRRWSQQLTKVTEGNSTTTGEYCTINYYEGKARWGYLYTVKAFIPKNDPLQRIIEYEDCFESPCELSKVHYSVPKDIPDSEFELPEEFKKLCNKELNQMKKRKKNLMQNYLVRQGRYRRN